MQNSEFKEAIRAAAACGITFDADRGTHITRSPITGDPLFPSVSETDPSGAIATSSAVAREWSDVPAPERGKLLLRFAESLLEHEHELSALITAEVGKPTHEALGEIEETVDMCTMASGLSRRLQGQTLPSSRPGFRLMETFRPIGPVGVITPFSFPAAAWGWSAPLALMAGNPVIWKPSPQAPITARAIANLLDLAAEEAGLTTPLCQVVEGDAETALQLARSIHVPVITAYGRSSTGRRLGAEISARLGRSLLQLGGNNASVVAPSADLDLAVSGTVAAATAAAGQRCTSMRRVIVHEEVLPEFLDRLVDAYDELTVGDPRSPGTQVGPLVNKEAFDAMQVALSAAEKDGGEILAGGGRVEIGFPDAYYVRPAIVRMGEQTDIVRTETVAPILYVMSYRDFSDAVALNNDVEHGFSSSIYTNDLKESERFLAESDCGIININLHTSGAEIGTAFGGDKATGGGRQCGTDAWQNYVRRITSAVS